MASIRFKDLPEGAMFIKNGFAYKKAANGFAWKAGVHYEFTEDELVEPFDTGYVSRSTTTTASSAPADKTKPVCPKARNG